MNRTHLIHKTGHTKTTACTGAVTLIQRFGSALNLNYAHYGRSGLLYTVN
jgi:hypothetical protein